VLEDKIVQRAAVEVRSAIYETDFLGFSQGFRPRRSQHHARCLKGFKTPTSKCAKSRLFRVATVKP
jgi:retron-type reverse transcriptase